MNTHLIRVRVGFGGYLVLILGSLIALDVPLLAIEKVSENQTEWKASAAHLR
jgi:hypothetical protein